MEIPILQILLNYYFSFQYLNKGFNYYTFINYKFKFFTLNKNYLKMADNKSYIVSNFE